MPRTRKGTKVIAKPKPAKPHNVEDLPEEVRPLLFDSTENEFLSPHAISHFRYNGVTYTGIYQFFYAAEASFYEDSISHENIMATPQPELLGLARVGLDTLDIGEDGWVANREEVVETAIQLTYEESENFKTLQDRLLATGDRPLAFASEDKHWGIGMPLAKAKENVGRWPGKNVLGKMLEGQRRRLVLGQHVGVQRETSQEQDDRMSLNGNESEEEIFPDLPIDNSFEDSFMEDYEGLG